MACVYASTLNASEGHPVLRWLGCFLDERLIDASCSRKIEIHVVQKSSGMGISALGMVEIDAERCRQE